MFEMLRLTTSTAVAVGIVALGLGVGPVHAAATTAGIRPMCAEPPVMKVWYDADQTGSWANAWLEKPPSCSTNRWAHIALRLYCIEGTPKKLLANRANSGEAAVETAWTLLPKTCTKFRAYGDLANIAGIVHSDVWSWRYGYPPA
jgi:disulfide bond formation protein DsbB